MVPCQPRQLLILSLPFAALVAFYWFKRRRSLSRSDPGGTSDQKNLVDKPVIKTGAHVNEEENTFGQDKVKDSDNRQTKSPSTSTPKAEEKLCEVKREEQVSHTPFKANKTEKPGLPFKNNKIDDVKCDDISKFSTDIIFSNIKEEIICNGSASKGVEKSRIIDNTEISEANIFNSTVIESDIDFYSKDNFPGKDSPKSVINKDNTWLSKSDFKLSYCANEEVDEKSVAENSSVVKESDGQFVDNSFTKCKVVPFEEQSTLENLGLKKNIVIENSSISEIEQVDSTSTLEEISESLQVDSTSTLEDQSDIAIKETISLSSDTVEGIENISTDTGVGSQDSSSGMAQGHSSDEKTESDAAAAGLEKKLASLGLDTQQATLQRSERDSANHSPAEVMLNSPAISTFSDAHSEGSSDSGKGCSDVVTPPSRTPAGGSSVAGDQVPSIYEFVLPQVIVGRLIGRHGAFLHDIRAKTHTNVFIKRHPETNSLKICAIEGTQQDIDAALKMIRQKFPLRRFPDLTLERVSFVKSLSPPINFENLQLHLVDGVNNDVILSSLISAGHFFLQLPMHMSYQSLYRLACIMNTVYSTEESPPLPDPHPDVVCVAPAPGGWYRAQILSVDEQNQTSYIRFLDYGGFVTVDNNLLRQIRGDFLLLPFQAIECALANVIPTGGEEEWSEEAKQFVQLMTTQQLLQAQVYEYTETGVPLVYLYCTQFYQSPSNPSGYDTKVVLLNQELVERGFAELIEATPEETEGDMTASEST